MCWRRGSVVSSETSSAPCSWPVAAGRENVSHLDSRTGFSHQKVCEGRLSDRLISTETRHANLFLDDLDSSVLINI